MKPRRQRNIWRIQQRPLVSRIAERRSKRSKHSAVPVHWTPAAGKGRRWSAKAAEKRLRKHYSSDGSGDEDTILWRRYRRAFAWYDSNNPKSFESYKLPHHDIVGNKLVLVPRGLYAAAASVGGSRSRLKIPEEDREGVMMHLEKHYQTIGEIAPWKK